MEYVTLGSLPLWLSNTLSKFLFLATFMGNLYSHNLYKAGKETFFDVGNPISRR